MDSDSLVSDTSGTNCLGAIEAERKTGSEPFCSQSSSIGFDLLSFWQWSSSDLIGNALRGVLAEYIVALALGCGSGVRREWDSYDLTSPLGIKVEVKSAAYIQSWSQTELSSIQFGIQPTRSWNAEANSYSSARQRHADVYVFCIMTCRDKLNADPLNLDNWDFYCMSTAVLNSTVGPQKTIRLSRLLQLRPRKVSFSQLNDAIHQVTAGVL
ncbi:MAG: hypothetical protein AAF974_07655 [Cyanobacteria bacterium P01_E01_bin.34]